MCLVDDDVTVGPHSFLDRDGADRRKETFVHGANRGRQLRQRAEQLRRFVEQRNIWRGPRHLIESFATLAVQEALLGVGEDVARCCSDQRWGTVKVSQE